MRTSQIGNLHKRLITDAEAGTSRRPARRPFVPRASNVIGRIRYRQQQNHASAKPQAGPRRIGAFLLAAAIAVTASFNVGALTVSEDGTAATVTVQLNPILERTVTIPIAVNPGDAGDGSLSTTSLTFAPGETVKMFTMTAIDAGDESLKLAFGDLPPGVSVGSQAIALMAIADDGETTGQTATIGARKGRLQRNAGRGVQ